MDKRSNANKYKEKSGAMEWRHWNLSERNEGMKEGIVEDWKGRGKDGARIEEGLVC